MSSSPCTSMAVPRISWAARMRIPSCFDFRLLRRTAAAAAVSFWIMRMPSSTMALRALRKAARKAGSRPHRRMVDSPTPTALAAARCVTFFISSTTARAWTGVSPA